MTIDRDTYMKVCQQKPCLTEEIRAFFCGITCRKIADCFKNPQPGFRLPGEESEREEYVVSSKKKRKPAKPLYVSCTAPLPTDYQLSADERKRQEYMFRDMDEYVF